MHCAFLTQCKGSAVHYTQELDAEVVLVVLTSGLGLGGPY